METSRVLSLLHQYTPPPYANPLPHLHQKRLSESTITSLQRRDLISAIKSAQAPIASLKARIDASSSQPSMVSKLRTKYDHHLRTVRDHKSKVRASAAICIQSAYRRSTRRDVLCCPHGSPVGVGINKVTASRIGGYSKQVEYYEKLSKYLILIQFAPIIRPVRWQAVCSIDGKQHKQQEQQQQQEANLHHNTTQQSSLASIDSDRHHPCDGPILVHPTSTIHARQGDLITSYINATTIQECPVCFDVCCCGYYDSYEFFSSQQQQQRDHQDTPAVSVAPGLSLGNEHIKSSPQQGQDTIGMVNICSYSSLSSSTIQEVSPHEYQPTTMSMHAIYYDPHTQTQVLPLATLPDAVYDSSHLHVAPPTAFSADTHSSSQLKQSGSSSLPSTPHREDQSQPFVPLNASTYLRLLHPQTLASGRLIIRYSAAIFRQFASQQHQYRLKQAHQQLTHQQQQNQEQASSHAPENPGLLSLPTTMTTEAITTDVEPSGASLSTLNMQLNTPLLRQNPLRFTTISFPSASSSKKPTSMSHLGITDITEPGGSIVLFFISMYNTIVRARNRSAAGSVSPGSSSAAAKTLPTSDNDQQRPPGSKDASGPLPNYLSIQQLPFLSDAVSLSSASVVANPAPSTGLPTFSRPIEFFKQSFFDFMSTMKYLLISQQINQRFPSQAPPPGADAIPSTPQTTVNTSDTRASSTNDTGGDNMTDMDYLETHEARGKSTTRSPSNQNKSHHAGKGGGVSSLLSHYLNISSFHEMMSLAKLLVKKKMKKRVGRVEFGFGLPISVELPSQQFIDTYERQMVDMVTTRQHSELLTIQESKQTPGGSLLHRALSQDITVDPPHSSHSHSHGWSTSSPLIGVPNRQSSQAIIDDTIRPNAEDRLPHGPSPKGYYAGSSVKSTHGGKNPSMLTSSLSSTSLHYLPFSLYSIAPVFNTQGSYKGVASTTALTTLHTPSNKQFDSSHPDNGQDASTQQLAEQRSRLLLPYPTLSSLHQHHTIYSWYTNDDRDKQRFIHLLYCHFKSLQSLPTILLSSNEIQLYNLVNASLTTMPSRAISRYQHLCHLNRTSAQSHPSVDSGQLPPHQSPTPPTPPPPGPEVSTHPHPSSFVSSHHQLTKPFSLVDEKVGNDGDELPILQNVSQHHQPRSEVDMEDADHRGTLMGKGVGSSTTHKTSLPYRSSESDGPYTLFSYFTNLGKTFLANRGLKQGQDQTAGKTDAASPHFSPSFMQQYTQIRHQFNSSSFSLAQDRAHQQQTAGSGSPPAKLLSFHLFTIFTMLITPITDAFSAHITPSLLHNGHIILQSGDLFDPFSPLIEPALPSSSNNRSLLAGLFTGWVGLLRSSIDLGLSTHSIPCTTLNRSYLANQLAAGITPKQLSAEIAGSPPLTHNTTATLRSPTTSSSSSSSSSSSVPINYFTPIIPLSHLSTGMSSSDAKQGTIKERVDESDGSMGSTTDSVQPAATAVQLSRKTHQLSSPMEVLGAIADIRLQRFLPSTLVRYLLYITDRGYYSHYNTLYLSNYKGQTPQSASDQNSGAIKVAPYRMLECYLDILDHKHASSADKTSTTNAATTVDKQPSKLSPQIPKQQNQQQQGDDIQLSPHTSSLFHLDPLRPPHVEQISITTLFYRSAMESLVTHLSSSKNSTPFQLPLPILKKIAVQHNLPFSSASSPSLKGQTSTPSDGSINQPPESSYPWSLLPLVYGHNLHQMAMRYHSRQASSSSQNSNPSGNVSTTAAVPPTRADGGTDQNHSTPVIGKSPSSSTPLIKSPPETPVIQQSREGRGSTSKQSPNDPYAASGGVSVPSPPAIAAGANDPGDLLPNMLPTTVSQEFYQSIPPPHSKQFLAFLNQVKQEKRLVQIDLNVYERRFWQMHSRKILFISDIEPVYDRWERYRHLKVQLSTLEDIYQKELQRQQQQQQHSSSSQQKN